MLLSLLLAQAADPAAVMAAARQRTAVETRCTYDSDTTDITVCGRRRADRFRVPFARTTIARADDVPTARAELLRRNTLIEDMGPFLVGGGEMGQMVGVGLGVTVGGDKAGVAGLRQLAP